MAGERRLLHSAALVVGTAIVVSAAWYVAGADDTQSAPDPGTISVAVAPANTATSPDTAAPANTAAPPDTVAQVLEFFHAGLDRYFYSGDAGEIAAIDA
ncbi:MAG: hypothetical protein GYA65_09715, partial [Actinobacteria bacterium]|nr:hypothetical protein [Actinomycetota bacterium]